MRIQTNRHLKTQAIERGTDMDISKNNLYVLEEILDMDCSQMTKDDLEKLLNTELDKPAEKINSNLVEILLAILEPSTPSPSQIEKGFSELVDMIESDIALRTFVNAEGKPYQFSTVCDDIAFLMIEQYEKLGKNKPHEVKLLRSTAKKGQAALFLVIANIFQDKLDEAILGAVQGAYDYLLVAADLIGGMSGEDLEIQVELSTLHMDSINQLIKYAKMGECDNIPELNRIASEAHDKELHICSYAPNSQ